MLAIICMMSICLAADSGNLVRSSITKDPASFLTLDELHSVSDIIVKAETISSEPRNAKNDCVEYATTLRVISVFKGVIETSTIIFHHEILSGNINGHPFEHVNFDAGRSYIVFAGRTTAPDTFRQLLSPNVESRDLRRSVTVLLAANGEPVPPGKSVQDAIWEESVALLSSDDPADVQRAIFQMDPECRDYQQGGDSSFYGIKRARIAEAIHGFVLSDNEPIAMLAIWQIGRNSPYMKIDCGMFITVGGEGGGGAFERRQWREDQRNAEACTYWQEICSAADDRGNSAAVRSLAIRALGGVEEPRLLEAIERWANDPIAEVRKAAALLLTDFPGQRGGAIRAKLAHDEDAGVRATVQRVNGYRNVSLGK